LIIKQTPTTSDAYELLHKGTLTLADVSANGIRINTRLLQYNIEKVGRMIAHTERQLKSSDIWQDWRRRFGAKAKITSGDQLGKVLTEHYPNAWKDDKNLTATGRPKTDEETLSKIEIPFVQNYSKLTKLNKLRSTYLRGLLRELDPDGILHPMFGLGIARTYRGQSDHPNFQNMPIRIPWMAQFIRPCFIARPGRRLVETDFKALEVGVSACYNKDPKLIAYVSDPTLDMHRDMAAEIFELTINQVHKDIRHTAKNLFVFPQFYGDWYMSCAKNIWEAIRRRKLTLNDGTPLLQHLKTKGIGRLGACAPKTPALPGTFEKHLQEVEQSFWYDRFKVYTEWKDQWYDAYQGSGWFQTLTGFIIQGFMNKKEVINYPIQGSAFHCLLWSLIQLHNYIKRHKMKTLLVGQIHDSIIADVPENEFDQYIEITNRITTRQLPAAWPWIIVPMVAEVEASPVDGNWYEKKVVAA
jgi:DNA polymerase-1